VVDDVLVLVDEVELTDVELLVDVLLVDDTWMAVLSGVDEVEVELVVDVLLLEDVEVDVLVVTTSVAVTTVLDEVDVLVELEELELDVDVELLVELELDVELLVEVEVDVELLVDEDVELVVDVDVEVVVVLRGQQRPLLFGSEPMVLPTKWPWRRLLCPRLSRPPIAQMSPVYWPRFPSRTVPDSATSRNAPHTLPTSLIARKRTSPAPGTRTVAGPALVTRVALPTSRAQIVVVPAAKSSRPPFSTRTMPQAPAARSHFPLPGAVSPALQSPPWGTVTAVTPQGGNGSETPHAVATSPLSVTHAAVQLGPRSPSRSPRMGGTKDWAPGGAHAVGVLLNGSAKRVPPRVSHSRCATVCPGAGKLPLVTVSRPQNFGPLAPGAQFTPTLQPGGMTLRFFSRAAVIPSTR
jgi:hypothetical protein